MTRCKVQNRGWRCVFEQHPDGPCGLTPRWWNLVDRWKYRGMY